MPQAPVRGWDLDHESPRIQGADGRTLPLQRRIDTHLSAVLLTAAWAYKLKKPRHFAFVDFSTLAARRAACEAELRLNRRTAPHWYAALCPVCATADGPVLLDRGDSLSDGPPHGPADTPAGGPVADGAPADGRATPAALPGPLLDWAVKMHRFDPEQGYDRLAARGALTAAQVDALAEAVAHFHAGLPPLGSGAAAATTADITADTAADDPTATIWHWAEDNLRELASALAAPPPGDGRDTARPDTAPLRAACAALQAWQAAHRGPWQAAMRARQRAGRVREGHGDLHLGNVVWSEGRAVLFDALEFNAALRRTDTLGDLAFVFMDLQAHGRPDLAWRFLSAALEAADDHAALPLLPWWCAYRAAVRAKVAWLGGGPQAGAHCAQGLALALRLAGLAPVDGLTGLAAPGAAAASAASAVVSAAPAQVSATPADAPASMPASATPPHRPPAPTRPRLLLTIGLSGSGKSTLAQALVEALATPGAQGGAIRLRSDVERKRLHGLPPTARPGAAQATALYSLASNERTYARLQALATQLLADGARVVVDAACLRRRERAALRAVAATHGAAVRQILCEAPAETLAARLAARAAQGTDPSDATAALLPLQRQRLEPPDGPDEAPITVTLDTQRPGALAAPALRAWLALPA